MSMSVQTVGLHGREQDEALAFHVGKLGVRVHTGVRNGEYRWLTVQHPDRPAFQLGLFTPGAPVDRHGNVDAGSRDPSGNGWKMIQPRRNPGAPA
jgi:hypothetical protein